MKRARKKASFAVVRCVRVGLDRKWVERARLFSARTTDSSDALPSRDKLRFGSVQPPSAEETFLLTISFHACATCTRSTRMRIACARKKKWKMEAKKKATKDRSGVRMEAGKNKIPSDLLIKR